MPIPDPDHRKIIKNQLKRQDSKFENLLDDLYSLLNESVRSSSSPGAPRPANWAKTEHLSYFSVSKSRANTSLLVSAANKSSTERR